MLRILEVLEIRKEHLDMGRDEHKTGSKNANSLPQTPKNQKLSASQMTEEIAQELAALDAAVKQREARKKEH